MRRQFELILKLLGANGKGNSQLILKAIGAITKGNSQLISKAIGANTQGNSQLINDEQHLGTWFIHTWNKSMV